MAKKKQLYYSKWTNNGIIIDNKCPECDGDGVDFLDFTNAKGGHIVPQLCDRCDGKGLIDESLIDVDTDEYGSHHIIYKDNRIECD